MQKSTHLQDRTRPGITIIEVLTAMVVAMIGVFGVMVLIPFAVRQAETGLDYDDANRIAQNAVELFEIGGHDRLIDGLPTWYAPNSRYNGSNPSEVVRVGSTPQRAAGVPWPGIDVYVIDPLSIGFKTTNFMDPAFGQFPPLSSISNPVVNYPYEQPFPVGPVDPDAFPHFPEANLGTYDPTIAPAADPPTPALTQMTFAEAVRMFRSTDDLEFGAFDFDSTEMNDYVPSVPDSDLLPPRMYFDQINGTEVRRQSRGEMSWQMILVPVKDDYISQYPTTIPRSGSEWYKGSGAWKFRQFVLVYQNRVLDPTAMIMPVAKVVASPPNFRNNGGTVTLDRPVSDVRKNDWVMMVNRDLRDPDLPSSGFESGFEKQIGFYRVVDTSGERAANGVLTLDGPDFDFGLPNGIPRGATYVVHLVNYDQADFLAMPQKLTRLGGVVNVYERSFQLKGGSAWSDMAPPE